MANKIKLIRKHKLLGGEQGFYEHYSTTLKSNMRFSVFLPQQALKGESCPTLYFLAGLDGHESRVPEKAAFQRFANRYEIIVVSPDTSPRGDDIPDDKENPYLGQGASFYLNATEAPWAENFQMHDYLTKELIEIVEENFTKHPLKSIAGHSMGGYGALILGLRNPDIYSAISAFAPVCDIETAELKDIFKTYLGEQSLDDWNPIKLIEKVSHNLPILIDQGDLDEYDEMLSLRAFKEKCESLGRDNVTITIQEGYDHSYYFVRSFIMEHLLFHDEVFDELSHQ